jgi:hypothetical protein
MDDLAGLLAEAMYQLLPTLTRVCKTSTLKSIYGLTVRVLLSWKLPDKTPSTPFSGMNSTLDGVEIHQIAEGLRICCNVTEALKTSNISIVLFILRITDKEKGGG